MSVTSTEYRDVYEGSGDTYDITIDVRLDSGGNAMDIKVYRKDADNVQSEITDTCTISGTTVTTPEAYSDGKVIIVRDPALKQESTYSSGSSFPAKQFEDDLDYLVFIAQKLQQQIDNVINAPISDESTLELPSASDRAERVLGFDENGDIQVLTAIPESVEVSVFAETILDDASATEMKSTLSVDSDISTAITDAQGSGNGFDADTVDGHNITVSTSDPSGGSDGDIWLKREA